LFALHFRNIQFALNGIQVCLDDQLTLKEVNKPST